MTLTHELYQTISEDLKKDFPDIKEITQDNDDIIIKADDDVLWNLFETLYNGVENIEFNAGKNETHHIIIRI